MRSSHSEDGFVWFVGAGPGDPELLTRRGWRALQDADVVLHDALVDPALLADVSAPLINAGKRCGRHMMSQEQISAELVALASKGKRVVRLKGGDASVLGRVGEEALALTEAGVRFEIVPGVSSVTAVPSTAGIPVTHRGLADSFLVATAHHQKEGTALSLPDYNATTTVLELPRFRRHLL
ncbi:MAG: uroporphyrinogen-III C-methyltransferase [Myxococcota bacterium]|jgi:uroporphyrin-III C-methyltransferase|nr:uroporphyrinogen-III C-methyltransferase [Myxococcota bacterium]